MLHSLGLALQMKNRHNVSELVVSRQVFDEVLERYCEPDRGDLVRLNEPHDSCTYRFMHRVRWQGILFIHLSRNTFEHEVPAMAK